MTAARRGAHHRHAGTHLSDGEATEVTMQPPTIVPMTDEQHRRAVAALAELLLWAMENDRHDERLAA
jgi:hypothetical protein